MPRRRIMNPSPPDILRQPASMRYALPRLSAVLLTSLAVLAGAPTHARELPLWEAGVGVSTLWFPDYRGSNEAHGYLLPIPYFVYRGEFLKADRHGIRGLLFDTDRVELNVSVNASLPVDSTHNAARAGMPDLKPSVEIGPSLDLTLWRTADRRARLDLRLPVRTGVTVGSKPRSIGWLASPRLNLDLADPAGFSGWNLGVLTGPIYGSRRQHDYFYSVQPEFATAARPAWQAGGGYGGWQFLAALSKRYPRHWVGAFVRADTLSGAVFEDSPLVRRKHYLAAGVAISWILGESSVRVETSE